MENQKRCEECIHFEKCKIESEKVQACVDWFYFYPRNKEINTKKEKTCGNCKHWSSHNLSPKIGVHIIKGCVNPKTYNVRSVIPIDDIILIPWNFGCIHFEPKEESNIQGEFKVSQIIELIKATTDLQIFLSDFERRTKEILGR